MGGWPTPLHQARSLPLPTRLTSPAVEARADVQPGESPRPVPASRRPRPRPRSTQPWQQQSPSGASLSAARRSPEPSRARFVSRLDLQLNTESVVGSEMRTQGSTRPETRSVEMTVQPRRAFRSPHRGESTGQLFVAQLTADREESTGQLLTAQQLAADPSQPVPARTFRGRDEAIGLVESSSNRRGPSAPRSRSGPTRAAKHGSERG